MRRVSEIQPAHFARPRGYANGVLVAGGRTLYVAGQIGWDAGWAQGGDPGATIPESFAAQFAKTLDNVLAVVEAAGGEPADVVQMTVYVTDLDEYRASARALGEAWRARFGRHYPAMALVGVAGLVEPRARVEIAAVAVLPAGDAA